MKPLRLGAGSRIDSHGVEKDALPKIIFEDQGDTTQPSQSIELVDGALHVFNDPEGPNRTDLGTIPGSGGGGGQVDEVIAGDHVSVDDTDPTKPIVSVPVSGGPPGIGDPIVSDGSGGLQWGSAASTAGSFVIVRDLTAVDGLVGSGTRDSFRSPLDLYLLGIKASVDVPSSSGDIEIEVETDGSTIFGANKLVIEEGEYSSKASTSQPDIDHPTFIDDDLVESTIVTAGSGAEGLRVYFNFISGYVPQAVFSTVNKASDIQVLSGGIEVTSDSASENGGTVLSTSSKAAGKYYIEMVHKATWAEQAIGIGIHRGISGLTTYLGGNSNGWSVWVVGSAGNQQATYHNGVGANSVSSAFSVPRTVRVAVDISAGKLWLSYLGASGWIGSGDPASGSGPTYTFTPGGDFYFAACPRSGHASNPTQRNKIALTNPGDWAFSPPSGYGVWTA